MKPVILFDGFCNLCNSSVNFIIRHDKKKQFEFIPLQSEAGRKIILNWQSSINRVEPAIQDATQIPDSVILVSQNQVFFESEAGFKIIELIGFPWNLFVVFKVVPKSIRNKIYRWIARNRFNWFGKKDVCRIINDEEKVESIEKIL